MQRAPPPTFPHLAATGAPQLQTELDKTVYGVFNEPFQLACSAPGYDVAIAWYRDQVPISVLNPGMPTTERVAVASNGSLLFTPLELSDSGWYTCTASNTFGRDEIDFLLFVRGKGYDQERLNHKQVPFCVWYV